MNVHEKKDVFDRIDELKEMFVTNCGYPGYAPPGTLGIRKIVSVLNIDGDNLLQPYDKTEITYELYEFADDAEFNKFIEGKHINAKIDAAIKLN